VSHVKPNDLGVPKIEKCFGDLSVFEFSDRYVKNFGTQNPDCVFFWSHQKKVTPVSPVFFLRIPIWRARDLRSDPRSSNAGVACSK